MYVQFFDRCLVNIVGTAHGRTYYVWSGIMLIRQGLRFGLQHATAVPERGLQGRCLRM